MHHFLEWQMRRIRWMLNVLHCSHVQQLTVDVILGYKHHVRYCTCWCVVSCIPNHPHRTFPCPCTFGLCSVNIVRFLSCMLIQWPWQCVDGGTDSDGIGGVGVKPNTGEVLDMLGCPAKTQQGHAHCSWMEAWSVASSRGGTHKCLRRTP